MNQLHDICRPIAKELEQYDALFAQIMTHNEDFMRPILEFVSQRSGKKMRPILVLLLAKAVGEVTEATLRAAVALELLHTSSLIHDDVVDESPQRRGQQSLHRVFDNKIAVLLGDYLLSQTLALSAQTGYLAVVEAVAHLGTQLAEGEILQLQHVEMDEISESLYYQIIGRKTASLFEACAQVASATTQTAPQQSQAMRKLGEVVGLCFQIRDDIFDYYEDEGIGKPSGQDLAEGKLTLPLIHALHSTKDAAAWQKAMRVKQGLASAEERQWLIDFAKNHGGIAYAEAKMEELRQEAARCVLHFDNPPIAQALMAYIDFVMERQA